MITEKCRGIKNKCLYLIFTKLIEKKKIVVKPDILIN